MFSFSVFFFNDTATTEIYTLSLHDALPIGLAGWRNRSRGPPFYGIRATAEKGRSKPGGIPARLRAARRTSGGGEVVDGGSAGWHRGSGARARASRGACRRELRLRRPRGLRLRADVRELPPGPRLLAPGRRRLCAGEGSAERHHLLLRLPEAPRRSGAVRGQVRRARRRARRALRG